MRHILDWLKSEVVTIDDDDSGKSYRILTWYVLVLVFVLGWLVG